MCAPPLSRAPPARRRGWRCGARPRASRYGCNAPMASGSLATAWPMPPRATPPPCTARGVALWGQTEGKPVWLQCSNGLWQPGNGLAYAAEGDSCAEDADFGLTTGNVALVCSNGKWVSQAQIGLRSAAYYQHGATVPHPACRAGLSPSAVLAAVSASNIIGANNTGNNTGSFQANIDSWWGVTITGSDGAPAGNNAMALVLSYCNP